MSKQFLMSSFLDSFGSVQRPINDGISNVFIDVHKHRPDTAKQLHYNLTLPCNRRLNISTIL